MSRTEEYEWGWVFYMSPGSIDIEYFPKSHMAAYEIKTGHIVPVTHTSLVNVEHFFRLQD